MDSYLSNICGIHEMSNVTIISDNAKLGTNSKIVRRRSSDDLLLFPPPMSVNDLQRSSTDGSTSKKNNKAISKWDNGSSARNRADRDSVNNLLSPEVFFRKTIRSRRNSIDENTNSSGHHSDDENTKKQVILSSKFSFDPRWESETSSPTSSKLSARVKVQHHHHQDRRRSSSRLVRAKCA